MQLSSLWRKPKIGLALGSGGLGGAAHIGVLKVLAEAGLPIHAVTGTSVGAVVGGLYACGWSPEDMRRQLTSLTVEDLYDEPVNSRAVVRRGLSYLFRLIGRRQKAGPLLAFTRGDRIAGHLRAWTGGRTFADLPVPLAVVAADLATGQRVIFTSPAASRRMRREHPDAVVLDDVPVWLALRASMSIPGVFEPAEVEGRPLADGGLVDPVPDGLVASLGATVTVAVSLEGFAGDSGPIKDLPHLLSRAVDVMSLTIADLRACADLTIRPGTGDVGLLELERLPDCIRAGEEAARRALPHLQRLLRKPWARRTTGAW